MVPFDRFEFQSTFSLKDIATYNDWETADVVFINYQNHLIDALSKPDSQMRMFVLPEQELQQG